MRVTAVYDRPMSRAMVRVLQCVAFFGTDSNVCAITASTLASSIVRGAPLRGASSRPSKRCSANRLRHFETVCGVTRSRAATSLLSQPPAPAPSCDDAPRLPVAHVPLHSALSALSAWRPSHPPWVNRTAQETCDKHLGSTNFQLRTLGCVLNYANQTKTQAR